MSDAADPAGGPDPRTGRVELVSVRVGGTRHALELGRVERLLDLPDVTPVPGAPASVVGVATVQGDVAVVIDLRRGFDAVPDATPPTLVLLDREGDGVGLLVDAVEEVEAVPVERLLTVPDATAAGWEPPTPYYRGAIDGDDGSWTGVLDVEYLVTDLT